MQNAKFRTLVAMSGGVDSSLAAALLLEQGHQVHGITLDLFPGQSNKVVEDAQAVCKALSIPHTILQLHDSFSRHVIEPFVADYLNGLTPNPCAACNQHIKFGYLYEYMIAHKFDYLATGHYALIEPPNDAQPYYRLRNGLAAHKDQAYFLHQLKPDQLKRVLFPLGAISNKDVVRSMATQRHLPVAGKSDSEGICFVMGQTNQVNYGPFIEHHLKDVSPYSGQVCLLDQTVIGYHTGYYQFTVGQRRGVPAQNLPAQRLTKGQCVVAIDPKLCKVYVGSEQECYSKSLVAIDWNWVQPHRPESSVDVKLFNWGYKLKASLKLIGDAQVQIEFDQPVRGIAPGQFAVAYIGDYVIGGGKVIDSKALK